MKIVASMPMVNRPATGTGAALVLSLPALSILHRQDPGFEDGIGELKRPSLLHRPDIIIEEEVNACVDTWTTFTIMVEKVTESVGRGKTIHGPLMK